MKVQSSTSANDVPLTILGILMVTIGASFYVYEFYIRVIPSIISVELMQDFSITASMLGLISSSFYYAYTFMQIPSGLMCDHYGPKVLLAAGMICCGVSTFCFGIAESSHVIAISRFMCGAASAFAFICPLVLTSNWFPSRYFALVTGLIQALGCMGAIFGGLPLARLVEFYGWRVTLMYSGYAGILIGLLIVLALKDKPKFSSREQEISSSYAPKMSQLERLKCVLSNKQNWFIGIAGLCCWGPIAIFAELWGIQFIHHDLSLDVDQASVHLLWAWFGVATVGPFVGWISDIIQSRKIPMYICFTIGLIATLNLVMHRHISMHVLDVDLFLIGAAAGIQPITFGLIKDQNPTHVTGTAVAFNNMAIIFGGVILQPLFGFLLDLYWQGNLINNLRVYSLTEYHHAMWLLPICCLIGLLTTFFSVEETNCQKIA